MAGYDDLANDTAPENPRAGDTLGFGTGGGDTIGGGGGFGVDSAGGIGGSGPSGWQEQGRGSNVTDAQPQSPSEAAGGGGPGSASYFGSPSIIPGGQAENMYFPGGQTPSINVPQVELPFFSLVTGSTLTPMTVGTPSLMLTQTGSPLLPSPPNQMMSPTTQVTPTGQGYGGFQSSVVPSVPIPQTPYPSFQGSPFGLQNLSATSPEMDALRDQSIMNTEAANRAAGFKRATDSAIDLYMGKTAAVESGFGKFLNAATSSAQGLFQFTKDTWLGAVKAFRPDVWSEMGGGTAEGNKAILDLRVTDPSLQTDVMRNFTQQNADVLSRNNLPVNEASLYMSHFLGTGDAVKVLSADDNTPVSDIVSPASVKANPGILNGTVGDLKAWAAGKMSSVDPDRAKDFISSITGTTVASLDIPGGDISARETTGVPRIQLASGEGSDAIDEAFRQAANRQSLDSIADSLNAQYRQDEIANALNRDYTAAQAANASPESFGDWLSSLFDSSKQVSNLEAQGKTVLFPDDWSKQQLVDEEGNPISAKEWYRQDMERQLQRTVQPSEIKSRVVDYGSGPQVDYYIKDWGDKLGEMIGGISSGLGLSKETAGKAASSNPDSFAEWLSRQLNQPERRDYGPYSNLTLEEYRQLYGR